MERIKMEVMNKTTIYGILDDSKGFSVSNYTWTVTSCRTFWKRLTEFAFSKSGASRLDIFGAECLLGSIMSVTTEEGKDQLIGGQDGFIAILLLLKALRENLRFHEQQGDAKLKDLCFTIDRLVHGLNNCGFINENNSRIAMQGNQSFLNILLTGKISEDDKSKCAETYRFFQNKIFRLTVAQCFDLPAIVLYKCFLLHMKVVSQKEGADILKAINEMK